MLLTPNDLMMWAEQKGFEVHAAYTDNPDQGSERLTVRAVELWSDWIAVGPPIGVRVERGREILLGVIREVGAVGDGISSGKGQWPKVPGADQLQITVRDVEAGYFAEIQALVRMTRAERIARVEADAAFDIKVGEEIDAHSEVLDLNDQVSKRELELEELRTVLLAKRKQLREERQGAREAYRYVSNGREL